jgi:hypothetical protein
MVQPVTIAVDRIRAIPPIIPALLKMALPATVDDDSNRMMPPHPVSASLSNTTQPSIVGEDPCVYIAAPAMNGCAVAWFRVKVHRLTTGAGSEDEQKPPPPSPLMEFSSNVQSSINEDEASA